MKLVHGFKTYCERCVGKLRDEIGIDDDDPIDMIQLAVHLAIPVNSLADAVLEARADRQEPRVIEIYERVSAVTFFHEPFRHILYNEEHSPTRHRSNLAHELAHALRQHPPKNSGSSVEREALNEAEAVWFGGVMMLSSTQAKRIAATRMSRMAAEIKYQLPGDAALSPQRHGTRQACDELTRPKQNGTYFVAQSWP